MAMTGLVPTRTGDVHSQKSTETKPLPSQDIYTSLRGHSLFSDCSDEFIRELSQTMHMRTYSKGQVIVRKGEEGTNMYLIIIGSVRVGDESDELVYGTMKAGQFFGEMALLLDIRRTATVRANEFTATLVLSKADLQRVIQRYPDIGRLLQREAEERLQYSKMVATQGGSAERTVLKSDLLKDYQAKPISGVLLKIGLFQDMGAEFLHDLSMYVDLKSFRAGDIVFSQGDLPDNMYIILRGSVQIIINDQVFAELNEGSFFGEIGMLRGTPRTATVKASTYIDTFMMTRDTLHHFTDTYPKLRGKLEEQAEKRRIVTTEMASKRAVRSRDKVARVSAEDEWSLQDQLLKVSVFKQVNRLTPILNDLAPVVEYRRYRPGDTIVHAGATSNYLYFIVLGSVRVVQEGSVIAIMNVGAFFGEIGVLIGVPRVASIVAIENTACLELSTAHVDEVLSKYPDLYNHLKRVAEYRYEGTLRRQSLPHVTATMSEPRTATPVPRQAPREIHTINDLDPDLLTSIFRRVDVASKLELSRTCKYWKMLVRATAESMNFTPCKRITDDKFVEYVVTNCGDNIFDIVLNDCFDISDRSLRLIASYCPHLRSLELSSCWKVTNAGLLAIARHCSELMLLNLTNCFSVGDDGVCTVCEANPGIVVLGLGFCKRITDVTISTISRSLHHLTVLDLNRCEAVSAEGFKQVATGVLSELRIIRLAHCIKLESDALAMIAEGCPLLDYIDISFCQRLAPQSLTVLAEKSKKLKVIMCSYVPTMNDKSLRILCSELPELEHISLRGTDITMESIDLLANYPKIQVEAVGCKNIDRDKAKEMLGNRIIE